MFDWVDLVRWGARLHGWFTAHPWWSLTIFAGTSSAVFVGLVLR